MNIFGYPNLCHSVVPSPMQDMTGLQSEQANLPNCILVVSRKYSGISGISQVSCRQMMPSKD